MRKPFIFCLLIAVAAFGSGCTAMNYNNLELGARPKAYNDVLPRTQTRHIPLGRIFMSETKDGKTSAICLILGDSRRVLGKLMATHVDRVERWTGNRLSYEFVGVIDQSGLALDEATPEDVAEFLLSYLEQPHSDQHVREASDLIAIGLQAIIDPEEVQQQRQPAIVQIPADPNDPNQLPTTGFPENVLWRVPSSTPSVSAMADENLFLNLSVDW